MLIQLILSRSLPGCAIASHQELICSPAISRQLFDLANQAVGCLGDALKALLALQVKQDCSLLNLAMF